MIRRVYPLPRESAPRAFTARRARPRAIRIIPPSRAPSCAGQASTVMVAWPITAPRAGSQRERRASTLRRFAAKDTTATLDRLDRMAAVHVPRAATARRARRNPSQFLLVRTPVKRGQLLPLYARRGTTLQSKDPRGAFVAAQDTPARAMERTSPGSVPRARIDQGWIPSRASYVLRGPLPPTPAARTLANAFPVQSREFAASRVCSTSVYPRHAMVGITAALGPTGLGNTNTSVQQAMSVVAIPTPAISMPPLAARAITAKEGRHWLLGKRTNASNLITAPRELRHRNLW